MRFNEWLERLNKAHEKVKDTALHDISETIAVGGNNIMVSIGKDLSAEINGTNTSVRYLRSYFTHAKEEFESMLDVLEQSANEVAEAMGGLMGAITDEVIPEMVMSTVAGENMDAGNQAMLKLLIEKKMEELFGVLKKITNVFNEFSFSISIGETQFNIYRKLSTTLQYRNTETETSFTAAEAYLGSISVSAFTIEDGLKFVGQFELIKSKVKEFVSITKQLKELKGT